MPGVRPGTALRRTFPSAGFTLLELLVALAVLGLVFVLLSQGLQFGLRAWQLQAREGMRLSNMEAVDRTIRLLFERARGSDDTTDPQALLGAAEYCELITDLPQPPGGVASRMTRARLEVTPARQLVLRIVPHIHAQWLEPPPQQEITLLDGVERVQLSYYRGDPTGGGTWLRAWTAPDPPVLVRVRIVFAAGDPRRWPDIVVAPERGVAEPG